MSDARGKSALRKQLLTARRQLPQATVTAGSRAICDKLLAWPLFHEAKTVMGYLAMPGEPLLDELLSVAIELGKTVCVPLMGTSYGIMEAAAITGLDELVAGRLGVRMPDPSCASILSPALIDLVLTPGLAFDAGGSRLGMGAGYYDRFLVRAPQASLVGIAWTLQLVNTVPQAEHDILMHWIVTEDRLIHCAN